MKNIQIFALGLTLLKEFGHDVLVVIGNLHFFGDVCPGVFQVLLQVSVEILQPADFVRQPPSQRLLQSLSLTAALHQFLVGLGNALDFLLQLGGGRK